MSSNDCTSHGSLRMVTRVDPGLSADTAWVQGGNSFGATGVLGTLDAFPLRFISGTGEFQFAPAGTEPRIRIASSDPATSWWIATSHRIDFGTTDDVLYVGYNVGPGGSPVNPLKPRLWDAWESSFNNGASIVMERHVGEYVSVAGVSRRPLTFAYNLATNDVSWTATAYGATGTAAISAQASIVVDTTGAASSIGIGTSANTRTCSFATGAAAQVCRVGSSFAGSDTVVSCAGAAITMTAAGAVSIGCTSTFDASGAPTADVTGNGMRMRLSFGTAQFSNGGVGFSFAQASATQYNLAGVGGVTTLNSSLAIVGTTVDLSAFLGLLPTAEPASPGTGWRVYSDTTDGALKAKNSAGTVRTLALP